eukprot:3221433-Prymnesium_polylepis.1
MHKRVSSAGAATTHVQTRWPVMAEEYFEYVDVLTAVDKYASSGAHSDRPFAFVELGSGYGH